MSGVEHTKYIWMDGEFVPWDEARVHVLVHTLHYGLGAFEGIRAYEQADGGVAIFRLDDHLRRFEDSSKILQLDLPYDREAMRRASLELVARNELKSCYLRHLAYIGQGVMGLFPADNPVKVMIASWPWGAYLGEDGLRNGVRCKVSSFVRPFPNSTMTRAKAVGNYINSILAKREVIPLGYDEAIMMDTQGFVGEGTGENLFVVRDGRLKTPSVAGVLPGITRASLMRLAADEGIEVGEANITRDEVYAADEVFLCGTAAELTPVREVDDRTIGSGRPGPITTLLQERYFALIRGEAPDPYSWLERVPQELEAAVEAV